MKTLYLVRHAKSGWDNETLEDIDRPLSPRGYRDAYSMSMLLKEKKTVPDLIITSPAIRAISTALIFCRNLGLNSADIIIKPNLYETSAKEYLHVVKQTDDHFKNIMLFGHNPTITSFANSLTSTLTEDMPTCGIIGLTNDINHWKKFGEEKAELVLYDFPKKQL